MKNLFLLSFLLFSQAHAKTLSWDELIKEAKLENMTLKTAREQLLSAEYLQNSAYKGFLPSLRANLSTSRSGSETPSATVSNGQLISSTSSNTFDNVQASLNLNQNIFSGFKDISRLGQSRWQTQNIYWMLQRAKSDVSYALKEAFASLLYAQEYLELTKDITSRRESNYRIVKVRFESGRENKGSVLLAQAYLEQAQLDALIARDNLAVARKLLFSLINRDDASDDLLVGEPPLTSLVMDEIELKELALSTPDYHQAFSLEKAAEYEVSIARSAFIPSLDLSASVARNNTYFFPDDKNQRWSVALNLSIPLFDGLSDYSALKSATASRFASEASRRNAYLSSIPVIEQAKNLAYQSEVKLRVDSRFREASLTRSEIARAKYNNGLLTFEDWDIIESELINRQINYLQSKRDRIIKYAAFEKSIGKGSIP